MQNVVDVVIVPLPLTQGAKQHYRVFRREDGISLVEHSRDPEHDACRALFANGVTGSLRTFRSEKSSTPNMIMDIERGAQRSVEETQRRGPVTVPFRQRPTSLD